jgi:hypothetical protein
LDSDTDSDNSSDENKNSNSLLADFGIFACQRPQEDFPHIDISEGLSYQDMDRNFDWLIFFSRYNHPSSILDRLQAENPVNQTVIMTSSPGHLNPE